MEKSNEYLGIEITPSYPAEHAEEQVMLHTLIAEKFDQLYSERKNLSYALILALNYFIA